MASTTLESLPDDLVLKILAENLSAEDIHDSARLICRKWYHMTKTPSFAYSHLQHNTDYALLFMNNYCNDYSISMSLGHDGRVETSELSTLGDWIYICSCNGLMLRHHHSNYTATLDIVTNATLNIVNPVTKQYFLLPPIQELNIWFCSLAYAAVSMVYKVVARHVRLAPDSKWVFDCSILTLGVDNSWRRVSDFDTHFSYEAKAVSSQVPLVTEGGFLHWCGAGSKGDKVFTMDVETEIIRDTSPPPFPQMYKNRRVFLSTGTYLTFLVCCKEYLWEVWEMKPQTGEWRKVAMFSLEASKGMFQQCDYMINRDLAPIGWLTYPHVLVFSFSAMLFSWVFPYNLATQVMESFQLPRLASNYTRFNHRSSLVRV